MWCQIILFWLEKLARQLKRPFVDVDAVIEKRLGVTIQTIFDTEGEAGFRQRELTILRDVLKAHEQAVIATGGGCILTEQCRQLIMKQRLVVHVDVGLKHQSERLRYDKRRPILQGGNLLEKLKKLRADRHDIYASVADCRVATDKLSFRKMIAFIQRQLEK